MDLSRNCWGRARLNYWNWPFLFFPCCFRSTLTPAAVSLSLRTPSIITQVLMSWKCWSFEFNWRITHGSFKKLLREGLPILSKPTCCFHSTLTSATVFLLLMTLSMVTQVQACDADEFSRKMGNFSWTFQEIAEGGPRLKLLNLILFALSLLLSIDLDLRRRLIVHQDALESHSMNEFLRLLKFRVTAEFDGWHLCGLTKLLLRCSCIVLALSSEMLGDLSWFEAAEVLLLVLYFWCQSFVHFEVYVLMAKGRAFVSW